MVARAVPSIDLDALMMPEIDGDIKSLQVEMGAIFDVSVCRCTTLASWGHPRLHADLLYFGVVGSA